MQKKEFILEVGRAQSQHFTKNKTKKSACLKAETQNLLSTFGRRTFSLETLKRSFHTHTWKKIQPVPNVMQFSHRIIELE